MLSGGGVPEVELDVQDNFICKSPTERGDFIPLKKKKNPFVSVTMIETTKGSWIGIKYMCVCVCV